LREDASQPHVQQVLEKRKTTTTATRQDICCCCCCCPCQKLAQLLINIYRVFYTGFSNITEQNIQNSIYVYNMAEATASAEPGYQEVFAAFFVGASEVGAQNYSIKQLHKDIPDFARLIGVLQDKL
jgi:hypothetical protein